MSFPRYPKYKPSGVEWLGEVPEHWEVTPLGRVSVARCDGPFGSGLKSEHYADCGVRVVRLQNIREGRFDDQDAAFVARDYYDRELTGHEVVSGDLLIAGLGDENNTVGRTCVAPDGIEPAMVKADCFRFRIDSARAESYFVATALSAGAAADAGVLATGSTRMRIPLSAMVSRRIPLPPLPEQRAIAAFLDRETAKIDALVAEQQRLIELLKEKRQAVISHAVTKGLNPAAPMKDSGVEWLGEVPEHWEVKRSRRLFSLRDERARLDDRQLTASQEHGIVYQDDFMAREGRRVVQVLKGADILKHVEPHDFVISMRSFEGGIEYSELRGCISSAYVMLIPGTSVTCQYFKFALKCQSYIQALQSTSNLVRDGQALRYANFVQVDLPLPPLPEQRAIAAFLDRETAKIDALTAEADSAITLLQERRAALISAAVTGQIDVRHTAPAEVA